MQTNSADLLDVQFSLQTVDCLVIEAVATLRYRAPSERAWVVDAHQKDGHLTT